MTPMGLTSTHFISYHEINIKEIDLIEDAWGLNVSFRDVIELLGHFEITPEKGLTDKLIDKIRKHY